MACGGSTSPDDKEASAGSDGGSSDTAGETSSAGEESGGASGASGSQGRGGAGVGGAGRGGAGVGGAGRGGAGVGGAGRGGAGVGGAGRGGAGVGGAETGGAGIGGALGGAAGSDGGAAGQAGAQAGAAGSDTGPCVLFVATTGDDAREGTNWDSALASVQAGIDLAADRVAAGAPSCEVWVAEGEYLPTRYPPDTDDPLDPRALTFLLKDKVGVYGGFSGTETVRSEDRVVLPTTLSGDLGVLEDRSDNVYHVVTAADGAILSDFYVSAGNANGTEELQRLGGGLLIGDTSPTIIRCYLGINSAERGGGAYIGSGSPSITGGGFDANSATDLGGGVYIEDGSPVFTDFSVSANEVSNLGGGIYSASGSFTFSGGNIASDHAIDGGGIYVAGGAPVLQNVSISGNSMTGRGGALFALDATVTLTGCQFGGNQATESGGSIYANGATLTIDGCDFSGNTVQNGAGAAIDNEGSTLTITRTTFQGCSAVAAEQGGGAIRNRAGGSIRLENCTFAGNTSNFGGALLSIDSSFVMYNSLFYGNTAINDGGAAVYVDGGDATVTNCIFWQNMGPADEPDIVSTEGSTLTVTYSDVEGGCTVANGCTTDETGNIDADPLFDLEATDYRLGAESPCIDTGTGTNAPEFDVDQNPRVDVPGVGNDTTDFVDMGPREYQP